MGNHHSMTKFKDDTSVFMADFSSGVFSRSFSTVNTFSYDVSCGKSIVFAQFRSKSGNISL